MVNKARIIIITLVLLVGACKKKPAIEIDELFVGIWIHNSSHFERRYLIIRTNGKGDIQDYENDESINFTKTRKWLIKNNTLYFGWTSGGKSKFSIDQYPLISVDTIINNYDTIYPNQKYMILDGDYYVD